MTFLKLILDRAGEKGHHTQICNHRINLPVSNRNPIQFYSGCTEQSPPLPSWQKNRQNCHFPKLLPHAAAESHLRPALLFWASLPQCLCVLWMLCDSPFLTWCLQQIWKMLLLLLQELKSTFPDLHIFLTTSLSEFAAWISIKLSFFVQSLSVLL